MGWETNILTGVWLFVKDKTKPPKCEICETELLYVLTWGIPNGVAVCQCGAQYTTLHRDGPKLLDKKPTCHVPDELVPKYREAWKASADRDEYLGKVEKINEEWDKK